MIAGTLACAALVLAMATPATAQSRPSVPLSPIPEGETRDAQARFGALRASPSSAELAVTAESLSLRCEEAPDTLALCTLEVRWTLASPRALDTTLYASVVGVESPLLSAAGASSDAPSLAPLTVHVEAETALEVVLTGRVRVRASQGSSDALDARHLVLATPRQGPHATVLFTRAVARTFASGAGALEVSAALPDGFSATVLDLPRGSDGRVSVPQTLLEDRASIPVRVERRGGFPLRHGGPFIGLGGTFDRGFRGRLGYELGIDELVIVSVAVDSDFTDSVVIGAVVEVATPSFVMPPSISAGVGFAYRQRFVVPPAGVSGTSAGLRLEVGAVFAVVGIIASFDYFPDDAAFISSLLGRLSI